MSRRVVPRPYYRPSCGPRDAHGRLPRRRDGPGWAPPASRPLATVACWAGPDRWLAGLGTALRTAAGETARKAMRIRVDTVLDVAAIDARAADTRTGRDLATAHATVAALLGCSAKTVQRARTLITTLGYAVVAVVGRYLTATERAAAVAVHGGDQRRIASWRALTVPRPDRNVHLPRRGPETPHLHLPKDVPTRAAARNGAAPRPAPRRKTTPRTVPPRPTLAVQRLAAGIARRLPWLATGHIGNLCAVLTRAGLDDTDWSARDVIDLIDQRNTAAGLYALPPRSQRNPLALFTHQLHTALADITETPKQARARRATEAAARTATQQAALATAAAQRAAIRADPAIQARITTAKNQIRAILQTHRRTTRSRP